MDKDISEWEERFGDVVKRPEVTFTSFKEDLGNFMNQLKMTMILSGSDQYTVEDLLNITYLIAKKELSTPLLLADREKAVGEMEKLRKPDTDCKECGQPLPMPKEADDYPIYNSALSACIDILKRK